MWPWGTAPACPAILILAALAAATSTAAAASLTLSVQSEDGHITIHVGDQVFESAVVRGMAAHSQGFGIDESVTPGVEWKKMSDQNESA